MFSVQARFLNFAQLPWIQVILLEENSSHLISGIIVTPKAMA
jgi:hypothetical protein